MNRESYGRAPATILLVDDQRFVGIALGRLLEGEADFQLHVCEHGADALAFADRLSPALILQDLVMPGVDGLALVALYGTHPSTVRTPVVVLSGNDDNVTRARAFQAGAIDYLVKLPSREVLTACLRRHLSMRDARHERDRAQAADAPPVVLDPDVIESFRDESAADPSETLRTLIEVFLTDADSLVAELRDAVQRGDAAVPRLAHTLKGCASAVGASRLAALCAEIEAGAENIDIRSAVEAIDVELTHVREACLSLR